MTKDTKTCPAYDQISDRGCRYYAGHGGKHNFARLDHDCALERELRRQLDEMAVARDEACDIAARWFDDHPGRDSERITELRKIGT